MAKKASLEDQVTLLQKQFGGLVKLVKQLKTSVEALEGRSIPKEMDEVREILEAQRVVDEIIVANADAIKRIDQEMKEIKQKPPKVKVPIDTIEKESSDIIVKTVKKKCRYFNRGFCKYATKCRFVHSKHICKEHSKNRKCENEECQDRHPKSCKWLESKVGCKRNDCEYLHDTLARNETQVAHFRCVSCKDTWTDSNCVVKHNINNHQVYFCLNCEDWVQNKDKVFDQGWTLLGNDGFLRIGI